MQGLKTCSKCKQEKPRGCFGKRQDSSDGLLGRCSDCILVERQNNSRKATCHPDRPHASNGLCKKCYITKYRGEYLKRPHVQKKLRERSWKSYGMDFTIEEYDKMFQAQGGVCAICGTPPMSKRLRVDHDHVLGRVRGLLCDYCNRRLLIPRNSIEVFEKAINYLKNAIRNSI